jgi:MFS family permease
VDARADIVLLFGARVLRMFGYGFLSVVLVLYLAELGFTGGQIGVLFALTLAGDSAVSLLITSAADRVGRRTMLLLGAGLMALAGVAFALTGNFALLTVAAVVGVISPGGNEVGPFLAIEQASLSHLVHDARRTSVFAWYNLAGSLAGAVGALGSGGLVQLMLDAGSSPLTSYRVVVVAYAGIGGVLLLLFTGTSPRVEVISEAGGAETAAPRRWLGLGASRHVVFKLSGLFALDAFAGGFVGQSLLAYWFHLRYGVEPAVLGSIFFGANVLAGISALLASRMAARFGLINTMVLTHVPSNVLLILVPLMPNLPLAIAVLLARFSISQMDVPTRQSYTMAVVAPDERSAAAGVTNIARTVGVSVSQLLAAPLIAVGGLSFFIAGGLKLVYDFALYKRFAALPAAEEQARPPR